MRIISGIYKSRRITAPSNLPVRPTTDAAKESLFNILANRFFFADVAFLDLFSGTGNITYEMASRGCEDIVSVDQDFKCTGFIKATISELGMKNVRVVKMDAFKYLQRAEKKFDIIFADPPYKSEETHKIHELVFEGQLLKKDGILIIEHGNDQKFSDLDHLQDEREVGNVNFTIFS